MHSVIAKNQLHTVSMYWLLSIVPGSPVSNLLAIFGLQATRLDPNNLGPSAGRFNPPSATFASPPVQNAPLAGAVREKKQASKAPPPRKSRYKR